MGSINKNPVDWMIEMLIRNTDVVLKDAFYNQAATSQSTIDLDKKNLPIDDKKIVLKALVKCSLMIARTDGKSIKERAKLICNPTKTQLLGAYMYENLETFDSENGFRPSDIRNKLPPALQNVQAACMTNLLDFYVRKGQASRVKTSKRVSKHSMPGPNSRYSLSKQIKNIQRIFAIPEVRKFIFSYLLELQLAQQIYLR